MSSARKRRDTDDAHLWMREAWDKLVTAKEYSDRNPALKTRCTLALDAAELAVKAVIIARNSSHELVPQPDGPNQHMVAVLNARGRLAVVMPHGVLFRGAAEGKIRQGLLQQDLFEAVIGLSPNLFYGTGIPASILVLNRDKPPGRQRKVLFIDASREFGEGINQNRLRDEDILHISTTFHSYADAETYASVVPLSEIEQNDWNLNISRYVDTPTEEDRIDVAEAVRTLRALEQERAMAEASMNQYLADLGFE